MHKLIGAIAALAIAVGPAMAAKAPASSKTVTTRSGTTKATTTVTTKGNTTTAKTTVSKPSAKMVHKASHHVKKTAPKAAATGRK